MNKEESLTNRTGDSGVNQQKQPALPVHGSGSDHVHTDTTDLLGCKQKKRTDVSEQQWKQHSFVSH